MTYPDLRKAKKNFLVGETPGNGDNKPRTNRSKTLSSSASERRISFDDTWKLYRANTEPISCEGMFAGSFKDDNYYRSFLEDAKLTEQEVFYDNETNEGKKNEEERSSKGLCCCLRKSKSKSQPKLLIKNTTVDQGKLNKILVG